jgi:ankyrin repeat protein
MSDAIPLPTRPDLDQYKKLAKGLLKACKSGDFGAVREWAARWTRDALPLMTRLRAKKISKLADAQLFLARAHGFESWPKFAKHIEALKRAGSPDATFEAAADAIVSGDIDALARLLKENPELIRQRSSREHRSTLLHYGSANGIEDFRQKTPKNIVEIARLLLDAGAEVNAESDAYGGRSLTLGLVATSIHPNEAGLQIPLLDLLLERGAIIELEPGDAVRGSLANGCPEAAEFLAARGAELDLEGAAGIGRLDVVKRLFADATAEQRESAFLYACGYGWNDVVEFMLEAGISTGVSPKNGFSGLHWAVEFGHLDTVELLLAHNAPLEVKNVYGGTVLGQAVWSAIHEPRPDHLKIIETLVAAGAKVGEDWFTGRPEIDDALQRGRSEFPAADRARFDRPDEARRRYEEAIALSRKEGNMCDLVTALKGLGQIERDAGHRETALALYEEAVAVCRPLGESILLAHTIRHLADLHYELGRPDLADAAYEEALAIYRRQKPPALDLANTIRGFAILKDEGGKFDEAERLWEEAHALYVAANVPPGVAECAARLAALKNVRDGS